MQNGGNLPKLVKYSDNIKDITISKFAGVDIGEFGDCYYINFTEIIKKEVEKKGFLGIKKKVIIENNVRHMLPFTFKSLDIAKDFAQYIPGLSIEGERLYINKNHNIKIQILYETYKLFVPGVNITIYLKFIPICDHQNIRNGSKRDKTLKEFYINDLDKLYFNGDSGNWYSSEELVVDGFFTTYNFESYYDAANVIEKYELKPKILFDKLSDIKNIEVENMHKFVLVEESCAK